MNTEQRIETLELQIASGLSPEQYFDAATALKGAYMSVGEKDEAYRVARKIIVDGTAYVNEIEGKRERNKQMQILESAYVTLAPDDFSSFLIALEWNRTPKERFYLPRIGVLKPIADAWTDMFVNDKYDMMLFSMPPGTGKTTLGIMGCCWIGWRDPEHCNLMSGYAEKITKGMYKEINSIFTDPEYGTAKIFPKVEMVDCSAKDLKVDFTNRGRMSPKRFTTFTCRSIDGSLTGDTRCENLLYVDDLVSNSEEAMNIDRMDTLWEKYTTDLSSRKKDNCKEIHIGTRWSVHDPIGRLEEMHKDNERMKIIKIPALDENGKSNFVYDYGLGFSDQYYKLQRAKMDPISWGSLYMQEPIEREGLLFPREEIETFYAFDKKFLTDNPPDDIFAFVDVAFGGNDYLSMPILAQWGDDAPYVIDWVYMKGNYEKTQPVVEAKLMYWGVQRVTFESNNGGDFYAKDIRDSLRNNPDANHIFVTTQRAGSDKSKLTRITQHSPVILGMRFLNPEDYPSDKMYANAMQNLCTFTQNGKNRNDDAPDSLAGAAAMLRYSNSATVNVVYDRRLF